MHVFDQETMIVDDNDSRVRPLPISFIRSGNYYLGALYYRGSRGRYWSAVGYGSAHAYYLFFYSGYLGPQDGYTKNSGFAVRCVIR